MIGRRFTYGADEWEVIGRSGPAPSDVWSARLVVADPEADPDYPNDDPRDREGRVDMFAGVVIRFHSQRSAGTRTERTP